MQGALDRALQLRDVVGLAHVVVGTAAQGGDRGVDRVLATDDDHRLVALVLGQPVEQGEAIGVGQAVVEQDERVVLVLEARDRLADRAALVEDAIRTREHMRKSAAQRRVVVDDQDAKGAGLAAGRSFDLRPKCVLGRCDHGSRGVW